MSRNIKHMDGYNAIGAPVTSRKRCVSRNRAENKEYIDSIKKLNELYDSIPWGERDVEYSKEMDMLNTVIESLPQTAFL